MANMNSVINKVEAAGKVAKKIAKAAAPLGAAVPIIQPVAEKVIDFIADNKDLVRVPTLYSKNSIVLIADAKHRCVERGLKPEFILAKEDIKYKDYSDGQVVLSKPKQGDKVEKDSPIEIYYVSAEVIEDSRALYKTAQKLKAQIALKKTNEKLEKLEDKISYETRRFEKVKNRLDEEILSAQKKIDILNQTIVENS